MNDAQVAELSRTVIDHIADMVVVVDRGGMIRFANARAEQVLGLSRAEWIGRPVFEIIHADDLTLALELFVTGQAAGPGLREIIDYRVLTGDGTWLTVAAAGSNIDVGGGELALVLSCRPLTARRSNLEIVDEAGERLSQMFNDAAIGMAQTALDGRLLRVNQSFADMLGTSADQLVGRTFSEFTHPDDIDGDLDLLHRLVRGDFPTYRRSKRYITLDGRTIHVELTASLVRDRHGVPLYYAAQTIDVSALKEAEAELVHRSNHDPLTGLANRALLHALLGQALSRAARRDELIALLFLDLDGFKAVNDTHGHATGDALLVEVARRLTTAVRTGDLVCRFGGDEFVVVCEHPDRRAVEEIAARIIHAISVPFHLGAVRASITVSVGLAIEDAASVTADDLIAHADTSLYRAKTLGGDQVGDLPIGA